ncbi:MAG TPA: NAD-binding protein [Thermoleophilia bacterium]|nr:NAD-binding protein [Thermoleophilia bacterium]
MFNRGAKGSVDLRRLLMLAGILLVILAGGTIGYTLIEGWSILESLYMTVITLSTVGFKEVREISSVGRLFTILLILGGVSTMAYALATLIEFVVSGQLSGLYRRRTVRKAIEQLSGHFIICGFGRVGEAVAREFRAGGVPFVVVDDDEAVLQHFAESGMLFLLGDATEDDVLEEAGIRRARGLVAAVGSDAENVFIILSARVMCPDLMIVGRANSEESFKKIKKAGADHVVSPYSIGGKKMATLLLKPLVSDYLEVVTGGGEVEFRVEEFALNDTCEIVGRSIGELEVRSRTGATILAVRHGDSGLFDTNPKPTLVLSDSDVIIAIGTPTDIANLEELFACRLPSLGGGR